MRRRRRHLALVSLAVLSILAAACATRTVPPIGASGQPFRPHADEVALWARAAKEEHGLLTRVRPYDDPLLDDYLGRVVERLVAEPVRVAGGPAFNVRVLRDPTLNAFAMPNGRLFVHTGLLSALDNEAHLAAILAHEMTHVIGRHALRVERQRRAPPLAYTSAGVLSPAAGAIFGLSLPLARMAAIDGYGRALERDADRGAIDALVRAGYHPGEMPRLFEALRRESRDRGALEIFLLGNRRELGRRVDTTRRIIRSLHTRPAPDPSRGVDSGEFSLRMRPVVRDNAYEDIRAGRFPLAQRQLDRVLAATPDDALAHVYYGELHRLQAQRAPSIADTNEKAYKALASYERAVALDPALADPHRQLALLYYQQGDAGKARAAFEKYLALAPHAADAARIRGYIAELGR